MFLAVLRWSTVLNCPICLVAWWAAVNGAIRKAVIPHGFRRAHRLSVLGLFLLSLVYIALIEEDHGDSEYNMKRWRPTDISSY